MSLGPAGFSTARMAQHEWLYDRPTTNRRNIGRDALGRACEVAEGAQVVVLESTTEFTRIRARDGREGWVPAKSISVHIVGEHPQVIVRTYQARSQEEAAALFQAEAATLTAQGYRPTSQSWAQGSWGGGMFLVALLLAVILVGIVIFIYMLLVKPEGTLTVTYERQTVVAQPPAHAAGAFADDLAKLAELRDRGVLTEEEFAAKKKQILAL